MMILSPAIVLKDRPSQNHKVGRNVVIGALLVLAGLGMLSVAAARRDPWD
jgi:hypothetical protein